MKKKIILLILFILVNSIIGVSATTLYDFKKDADVYIISEVGQNYFEKNFEYLGDKPYPEDILDSLTRTAQYTYKIIIGDYIENITVTVWFEFRPGGIWNVTKADDLPDCVSDNKKCMPFEITREKAIEIAKENGVFDRAEKYTAKIHYFYGNISSYIWDVTSFESAYGGKNAIIDLNTGQIIILANWAILEASPDYNSAEEVKTLEEKIPHKEEKEKMNYLYYIVSIIIILLVIIILILKIRKK